jgi:hypothetical protein
MYILRVALLAVAMFPVSAFAECQVDRFRWSFAGDSTFPVSATVESGGQCDFVPQASRSSGIESVTVISPPSHGSASTNGSVASPTVTYRSTRGFHGVDKFSFAIKGAGTRGSGTATMLTTVTVK